MLHYLCIFLSWVFFCALPRIELSIPGCLCWLDSEVRKDFFLFSWHSSRGQVHPCLLESPTMVGEKQQMMSTEVASDEGSRR